MNDKKLRNVAQTSEPTKLFTENIFPKYFSDAAQDGYIESQETYRSLFEDQMKYKAIMEVLGQIVYRDMRQQWKNSASLWSQYHRSQDYTVKKPELSVWNLLDAENIEELVLL